MSKSAAERYPSPEAEILDRVRRIETRFTRFAEHMGFDTQTSKAEFVSPGGDPQGVCWVKVPSPMTSIKEIMRVIPPGFVNPVPVMCGMDQIGMVLKPVND